jgi:hypothetical protein
MPLDWAEVKKRYQGGTRIPTVAGGRTLEIVGVDDEAVYIRNPLWSDALRREHLEKAVKLIEAGRMTRHAGLFVEEYRTEVADVRATSAAHVLKDFGILE